jgi:hypothetical protein
MRFKEVTVAFLSIGLYGCVSGAPRLSPEQESQVSAVTVYKAGDPVPGKYQTLDTISAANCSGAPAGGRVWGNAEKAIDTLKEKAVEMGANALINVSCSSIPLLNNCWAAQKCSGEAIRLAPQEHN